MLERRARLSQEVIGGRDHWVTHQPDPGLRGCTPTPVSSALPLRFSRMQPQREGRVGRTPGQTALHTCTLWRPRHELGRFWQWGAESSSLGVAQLKPGIKSPCMLNLPPTDLKCLLPSSGSPCHPGTQASCRFHRENSPGCWTNTG